MPNAPLFSPPPGTSHLAHVFRAIGGALLVTLLDALLLVAALGSVRALMEHRRALALLAVWATGGIVLALLRPVRTHKPTDLKQESPSVLVALLAVPLLTPPVAALGERFGLLPWFAHASLEWMGIAIVALGLGVRIAAMAQLGSRFSPFVAVQEDHVLETGGVYSRIRHPGYSGALLACAGGMLAFGSALALPLVVLFVALLRARVAREETLLEHHFGDDFRRYRGRTGGLLPWFGGAQGV